MSTSNCAHSGLPTTMCAHCRNGVGRQSGLVSSIKQTNSKLVSSNLSFSGDFNENGDFITQKPEIDKDVRLRCKVCDKLQDHIFNMVYARWLVSFIKESINQINCQTNQEIRRRIKYPKYETGNICKECFDTLYKQSWEDDKGVHKVVEGLPFPSLPKDHIQYRREARDFGDDRKDKVKSVTKVCKIMNPLTQKYETVEVKVDLDPEPVEDFDKKNPGLYLKYFNRGRRIGG